MVYTEEKLKQKINKYFALCEADGVFPDCAGMRVFLALTREEADALCENAELRRLFDMARDRRESYLVRRMIGDGKNASGCMNALRQSENGGYNEKSDSRERALIVKMVGVGEGAFE